MVNKKIILDFILNSLASFIPILTLQFVILPMVSTNVTATEYGKILTIVGLLHLFSGSMGNVLNNIRLINFKKYKELKLKGDFAVFLLFFIIINISVTTLGMWYYDNISNPINIVLILAVSMLILISGYADVEFRINLSYKKILINGICLTVGYLIGLYTFVYTKQWEFIYLSGYFCSVFFIWKNTSILKESLVKTSEYLKTRKSVLFLLVSGLLLGTTVYIDRLLLYPLLGGVAVSIYYTSTLLGKTISLALQPIASVLLSYLVHAEKIDMKKMMTLLLAMLLLGVVGYFIVIVISRPLLSLMYPQFVEAALNYIYITTLSSILIIMSNVLNPILLRFYNLKWQLSINFIYIVIYLIASLILADQYHLMGFVIGALIASGTKLFISLTIIFLKYNIENGV